MMITINDTFSLSIHSFSFSFFKSFKKRGEKEEIGTDDGILVVKNRFKTSCV